MKKKAAGNRSTKRKRVFAATSKQIPSVPTYRSSGSALPICVSGRMTSSDLCERTNDFVGAVHALVEMCQHADVPYFVVSNAANKFNGLFRSGSLRLDTEEKRILIRRLAKVMSDRISEADADDYSRLAWLNLHLNDERRARELTEGGLRLTSL